MRGDAASRWPFKMKTYLQLRDETKTAYLKRHEGLWVRLGFVSPWGHLQDEQTFNRIHAAITRAIAKHGPFDCGIDYQKIAWDTFRVVPERSAQGYRVVCDDWHIDNQALIEEIIAAVLAIIITIICPPLAIFAGWLGTIIVALTLLVLANFAAEFIVGLCGASPERHQAYLDQMATEAMAA